MLSLQGLVWVLNMFLQAECPDYRWTHDNEPPSVQQLIKGLQGLKSSPQPTSKVCWPVLSVALSNSIIMIDMCSMT